ncbi:hypothetical protein CONCODRAFT_84624 [Conidiobolus coronatus NRRL 28638]|uniref:Uncharacterized protein n=1 Tax=Conidiobolus coronatus (strain ATCC 28846 / CBS 209.66 / NRRL 28638) TaxID=796925 RepID=A0A137P9C2_CONC2|nr:hypothetical protein CONCODRAFT_84624 [Conidiobolus coronatus NRRL 28638]|eukprot:KXN71582.1 hypothetical protein CONCODRAFT_84624 [Conidiobolus coronatus NRRL 28638]
MIQTKELNEYYFNMEDRLIKLELITQAQLNKTSEADVENNLLKKFNNLQLKWNSIVNAKENIMIGLLNNHYKLLNSSVNKVEKLNATTTSTTSKTLEQGLNTSKLSLSDKYSELKAVETQLQNFLTQLTKMEQFEKFLNTEEFRNLLNLNEKLGALDGVNKEQLREVSEIRFKMNLILDTYNQSISAVSELFIYFNDMLNRLESQVNLLEKINNDQ